MSEPGTSQQKCSEVHDQADVINVLIEEYSKLTEEVKETEKKLKSCVMKRYALYNSILVKRIKFYHEKKWETVLRDNTAIATGLRDAKEKELQELQNKRIQKRNEECQKFSRAVLSCTNNFSSAQVEYSAENLRKCIEEYEKATEVINKKSSEMETQLNERERRYASEYLNAPPDGEQSNFDTVLKHLRLNNNRLHRVISNDNTIQEIQNRIKLRKKMLAEYKVKKTAGQPSRKETTVG